MKRSMFIATITHQIVKLDIEFLKSILEKINPKKFILTGDLSAKMLLGKEKRINANGKLLKNYF